MTKKAKLENYDSTARERDAYMLALYDVMNGDVVWSSWHREHDSQGSYRAGVSRLDSASGGLLLTAWRVPGQRDSVSAVALDDMATIGYIRPELNEAIWEARNKWHAAKAVAA